MKPTQKLEIKSLSRCTLLQKTLMQLFVQSTIAPSSKNNSKSLIDDCCNWYKIWFLVKSCFELKTNPYTSALKCKFCFIFYENEIIM